MASTELGARLTEQHRQAQVANQQSFLAEYLALWPLLDPFRLDATAPGWLQTVLRLIDAFRDQSAEIAVDYYRQFRAIEAPEAPELPPIEIVRPPEPIRAERRVARGNRGAVRRPSNVLRVDFRAADRAARTSMIVTGPVGIKVKTKRAEPVEQAQRAALVESSGAAMRHVIEGGRQTTLRAMENDGVLVGFARVTDADPCYFCAMLASRGPAYLSRVTAGQASNASLGEHRKRVTRAFEGSGSFKVHDHCACTVEPVYSRASEWPGRGREFQQLWNREIRNRYSGADAIRAWRRLYEQRQRDAEREIAA